MEEMECDNSFDEERAELIQNFKLASNTSVYFAKDYLENHKWDIKVALDNFFEEQHIKEVKILSWNLDGLDERFLDLRTASVVQHINELFPTFIFLQELVTSNETILRKSLDQYYDFYIDSQTDSYYCGILVKKHPLIKVHDALKTIKFGNSEMNRKLLMIDVSIDGYRVEIMTSHLESLKVASSKRVEQLTNVFSSMHSSKYSTIFAGDMNIRDSEIRAMNGLPKEIVDVALKFSSFENSPTWEPKKNINISENMRESPGLRFDRMYVRFVDNILVPVDFGVLVTSVDPNYGLHPSDHWAIVSTFNLFFDGNFSYN